MRPLNVILRIVSIYVFPILVVGIFFSLGIASLSPYIKYYLTWLLLLFVIIQWMSWGIWGGIVTIVITAVTTIYAWMLTGSFMYFLEILPALILVFILYNCEERIKEIITVRELEADEKERDYNLLLQGYKKQESLREAYYKKTRRFSLLSQIANELGFVLTPEEINKRIVSNLIKTIENGDLYLLWGVAADLQELELQVLESPAGELSRETYPSDEFNTWVMRHRQPLIVTDVAKDYRFNTTEILAKTPTRSLIMAPLITGDRLQGIIRIDSHKPETFSIDDLRLLTIISNMGALTLYNGQLFKQTEYLAIKDDLTGLYVKRYFSEKLEKLITEAQIEGISFSLLLLDLDRFKDLNDQFGHSVGDKILQKTAELMKNSSPKTGIVARYGGEEFAVILPRTAKSDARIIAEGIRKDVEEYAFSIRREDIRTTISIGLSEFPSEGKTPEELIDKADKYLYEAKRKGRNRVVG